MLTLVDERGFERATIAELARRTGLPASSIYWHFEDKDSLLAEAITQNYRQRAERSAPWPQTVDQRPAREQLWELLTALEGDGNSADYIRVGLSLALQRESSAPTSREAFLAIREQSAARMIAWWGKALDREMAQRNITDCEPRAAEAMGRLTMAALDGRYLTGQDITLTRANTEALAGLLWHTALAFLNGQRLPAESTAPAVGSLLEEDLSTRDLLLRSTVETLCDFGPVGATVSRITERVGLAPTALYWHFGNQETLVTEAVRFAFDIWRDSLSRRTDIATGDPVERLATDLREGSRAMTANPHAFRIGYMLLLQRGESPARDEFRRIRRIVSLDRSEHIANRMGMEFPRGDIAAVSTTTLAGILGWATVTLADGLFLVETVMPRWDMGDASRLLAEAFWGYAQETTP